jgi:hypothetical protein
MCGHINRQISLVVSTSKPRLTALRAHDDRPALLSTPAYRDLAEVLLIEAVAGRRAGTAQDLLGGGAGSAAGEGRRREGAGLRA